MSNTSKALKFNGKVYNLRITEGFRFQYAYVVTAKDSTKEKVLIYYALKEMQKLNLIDKSYMTRIRNGKISLPTAKKYVMSTLEKWLRPCDFAVLPISDDSYIFARLDKITA